MIADDALVGSPLVPYSIGDPGRAAREVVPRVPDDASHPSEMRADGGCAGPLRVRAASRRGLLHAYDGRPRQDEYALWADDRWVAVAVADGVSSSSMSHQAAAIASRQAVAFVEQVLAQTRDIQLVPWAKILPAIAESIVEHGRRLLEVSGRPPTREEVVAEMATTLVIAVVEQRRRGDCHEGAYVVVGDSCVYSLDPDGTWERIAGAKRGEDLGVASTATPALPRLTVAPKPVPLRIGRGAALFVMTDGIGDALGAGDGAVGRHLARLWAEPPDPLTFCAQVGFFRRSFDDDRTAVGVWAPSD